MNLPKLRKLIDRYFDEEELKTLCFDLNVDYDGLPAKGKGGKARELVTYCERNGILDDLIQECQESRPKADWKQEVQYIHKVEPDAVDPLRSAIWNALHNSLWTKRTFLNPHKKTEPKIYRFSEKLWIDYFNRPVPTIPDEPEDILNEIYQYFVSCSDEEWKKYTGFILNYWNDIRHYAPYLINDAVNRAFRKQGSELRYVPEYEYSWFSGGSIKSNPDDIYPTRPQGI